MIFCVKLLCLVPVVCAIGPWDGPPLLRGHGLRLVLMLHLVMRGHHALLVGAVGNAGALHGKKYCVFVSTSKDYFFVL